jgi:Protein of unknown function (DUF732)
VAVRPLTKSVMRAAPLAAALLAAGVLSATGARAAPVFCTGQQDLSTCSPKTPLPSAGDTAFLTDVRGHVPGDDARLLVTGRGVCNMLKAGENVNYVVPQVAADLGTSNELAGQVVDAATAFVCPGAPLNE